MKNKQIISVCSRAVALLVSTAVAMPSFAGAYIGASDSNLDVITHPSNYTGSGGTLQVGVCISPSSSVTTQAEIPVQNVIFRMNNLEPTLGNLISGGANNIPSNAVDAESALLHEVGHCIGLAHPNLATESGVPSSQRDYTKTTRGNNGSFDLNDGADNVLGSSDDQRGDDVNLHWFRISNNDPFTIATVVDSTTYARNSNMLPGGDDFAANASRQVASISGVPNTEAAMQQGQSFDEAQRTLGHDDVATLLYGASGVDEVAGTSDDYDIELVYRGITSTGCDVTVSIDSNTGFASCSVGLTSVSTGHLRITSGTVRLNENTNWFYNQTPAFDPPNVAPSITSISDQIVVEGEFLSVPLAATDSNEGDTLSFIEVGMPGFCSLLDAGDGTGSIDCSPLSGDAGNYVIQVFALDDGAPQQSDSVMFTLNVEELMIVDSDNDGVADDMDNCSTLANADQVDSNGDGYGNACDADFNNDCVVNVVDLGIMRTVFFTADADTDLNNDGVVNVLDLGLLRTQFFAAPGPSGLTDVCSGG
ncbi:MAG: thrombospondin type 3 repeat-containing protein [Gammaproteobacteria bacterium]